MWSSSATASARSGSTPADVSDESSFSPWSPDWRVTDEILVTPGKNRWAEGVDLPESWRAYDWGTRTR